MRKNSSASLTNSREHRIGDTIFIVNSFTSENGTKTAADLIMDMLISTIRNREVKV